MPRVIFQRNQITYDAQDGEWLYDACQEAKASVPFACKAGACGTCATEVLQGHEYLGEPRAREIRTLEANNLDPKRYRLLCLADVHGDLVLGGSAHAPQDRAALGVFDATIEAYRPLTQTVCEQRLRVEPPQFRFRPGQYMIFHVPEINKVIRRSYSISSSPADPSHFEICVRAVSGGYCSNYIHRLRPGATMQVEGPYGEFNLEPESSKEVLMIATGTGISPIKSMLLQLFERGSQRRIRLFFGLRHVSDLFYVDLLESLAGSHPNFEPVIVLSQPDPHQWLGSRGRVTHLIDQRVTEADCEHSEAYICGGREMIDDVKRLLLKKALKAKHVHHENFY